MSRPYVNINSVTYNSTTDVVSLDITALRVRGESTITFGGFTTSQTISLSNGYYSNSSLTFSANINGVTSSGAGSNATFTPSTATFEFSGTASGGTTKTNVKIQLWPGPINVFGVGGYTFSSTQSLATAVATLAANVSSVPAGVTSSIDGSGNKLIFTAPANTGAYYNGNDAKISGATLGTLGFTFSATEYTGTWSGGVTTISVGITGSYFGTINTIDLDFQ